MHGRPGPLRLEHAGDWAWSGVPPGSRLGGVLGAEYDGAWGRRPARRTTVLASAPIRGSSRRVAWTLVEHPSGAFVFSGSELGFSWQLDYRSLPSGRWIDTSSPEGSRRDYPQTSQVRAAVQRLVGESDRARDWARARDELAQQEPLVAALGDRLADLAIAPTPPT